MASLVNKNLGYSNSVVSYQASKSAPVPQVSEYDFEGLPNELLCIIAAYAGRDATKLRQVFKRIHDAISREVLSIITGDAQDELILPGDLSCWTEQDKKKVQRLTHCTFSPPVTRYVASVTCAPKITITIPPEFSTVTALRLEIKEGSSREKFANCIDLPESVTTLNLRGHDSRDHAITFENNVRVVEVYVCNCTLGGTWEICPVFPPSVQKVKFSPCHICADWTSMPGGDFGTSIASQGFKKVPNPHASSNNTLYYRTTTLNAVLTVISALSKLGIIPHASKETSFNDHAQKKKASTASAAATASSGQSTSNSTTAVATNTTSSTAL